MSNELDGRAPLERPVMRERWHGKQRDGKWIILGIMSHMEAMAEMDSLDLGEIATDAGLVTFP